ncbi:hypothetical protein E4T56_gene9228, partial [Termitomyces sp. T112]
PRTRNAGAGQREGQGDGGQCHGHTLLHRRLMPSYIMSDPRHCAQHGMDFAATGQMGNKSDQIVKRGVAQHHHRGQPQGDSNAHSGKQQGQGDRVRPGPEQIGQRQRRQCCKAGQRAFGIDEQHRADIETRNAMDEAAIEQHPEGTIDEARERGAL